MYHDFYQLTANPFAIAADPDFFYFSKSHADAISNLLYGIEQRKGILVITGEIGTGKTTLCQKLLKQASKKTKFALVLNPNFSELELLQMIVHDLGIRTWKKTKLGLIYALNKFLLKQSSKGNNVVIIIDEAQNLGIEQLEQIRLLSNLETEKEKLLQIVLAGQPELTEKLKLPELRQLRQRIAIHFDIPPLEKTDLKLYIQHRLNRAIRNPGAIRHLSFTEEALEAIYRFTRGFPRVINMLCDRALMVGYILEMATIDEHIIQICAKEVPYCEHYL